MNTAQSISRQAPAYGIPLMVAALLAAPTLLGDAAHAADLRVMATGLGEGTIVSDPPGIQCGTDCDKNYGDVEITLKAIPGKRSKFSKWLGDRCHATPEAPDTCKIRMDAYRSVRAQFDLDFEIKALEEFAVDPPLAIQNFLDANRDVKTPALFLSALPSQYRQNWILISRSESLQTGTAQSPRLLLPSADGQYVFTIGLAAHDSYPHSHPSAIEFMQWDPGTKNFRFHEIVLDVIPKKDTVPERPRGVKQDDPKCMLCHSTGSMAPGGPHKARGRPNWDTYDSWGGMMPFNRDRIYKGSVEAAAFRKIFDPWTWRRDHLVRSIIEQLDLQPRGIPVEHAITPKEGGGDDGLVVFSFDVPPDGPKLGTASTAYRFDGRRQPATEPRTDIERDADFIVLHNSTNPTSDEGRGVRLFDLLSGFNRQRIAGELIDHWHGLGNRDVRPIALAIAHNCLIRDGDTVLRENKAPLFPDEKDGKRFFEFFDARNGMTIGELVKDTRARAISLIRRKADIQKLNLHRKGDTYLISPSGTANGLIQQYDPSAGADPSMEHIRKQVFRRPIDAGNPDRTEMLGPQDGGNYVGIYVDREDYSCLAPNEKDCFPIYNTERIALYRYFLEPLGVSVDRWSIGVRGRSRTYTFADVFDDYEPDFITVLEEDHKVDPIKGLTDPRNCDDLIASAKSALSGLPDAADATPPAFAEVRRIFDKACVECHNGLRYPPYTSAGTNLSERPDDADPVEILARVERKELPGNGKCPNGLMPCGGPVLSKADIETLRRWLGTTTQVVGSSRITTVAGIDYDFQGFGEFVLLRGRGLEIQTRHVGIESEAPLGPSANTGLSSCASVVNGVAIKVDGHRITYQSRIGVPGPGGLELRIDGKLTKLDAKQIVLESGQRIVRTGVPGGLQIELPSGTAVSVVPGWLSSEKLWHFHVNVRQARATEGLMGAIRPGNWLPALPDGALLGPRPAKLDDRHAALYGALAKAWRVSDATSLFDYESGTSSKTFAVDAWPGRSPKSCRLPPEARREPAARALRKVLAKGVAEKHCSEVAGQALRSSCIQEVMATAEPGFAKTYEAGEQTQRKAFEVVPALVAPMHDETDVGAPVTFTWNAVSGSRGSSVSYLHCLWDADKKRFGFQDCAPVSATATAGTVSTTVDRIESGKSYLWKVIAEDGQGGSITSETRRLTAK